MMNINIKTTLVAGITALSLLATSCEKKLDLRPQNTISTDSAFSSAAGYNSVLAKIYGSLAVSGNAGPDAGGDLSGLDGGSQTGFIRGFFNCQELTTDEAVCVWNDQTIKNFHNLQYNADDPFIKGMYARPIYNITLANQYLSQATEANLAAAGISGADATNILKSKAEVRFVRAFNYWVMLDIFGKSTFTTETSVIGEVPPEISRADLYAYIESELLAIAPDTDDANTLLPAKTNEYGRADKAAAWALLARLYLNAEVYTGTAHYNEAATYAQKVINAGYSLQPSYAALFMADNDKQKNEFIFTINCDGLNSQAYSNTTFLLHAPAGSKDYGDYGIVGLSGGWGGYIATSSLASQFSDLSGGSDKRALFTTTNYEPSMSAATISDLSIFDQGLHVKKYVNNRTDGGNVSDPNRGYSDIDFPVFRLSEMYLIYAEAVLRGGAGSATDALTYVNNIRTRAYGNQSNNITADKLTLDFILAERGRELYWEGHRRTDLIRYGKLTTGTYLWPWKGGVAGGTAVDSKYNLFPIPQDFRTVNPNLSQNTGF